MKTVEHALIYPNVHEYMYMGMGNFAEPLLEEWRTIAAGYAEVSMLWPGSNKMIMAPMPIEEDLLCYQRSHWNLGELSVVTPNRLSSDTANDFLQDRAAMYKIDQYIAAHPSVHLIPWGATPGAYALRDRLTKGELVSLEMPERADFWSGRYFDTKVGFKELCMQMGLDTPEGFVCDSLGMAIDVIRGFCFKGQPCLLKANTGAGGFGNIFITKEMAQGAFDKVEAYIQQSLEESPYFNEGIMLVEEWIETPKVTNANHATLYSGFASGVIEPDGSVRVLAGGIDTHDQYGFYSGARLGKGVFPKELWEKLKTIMLKLGERISRYGYRGHWGINYMLRKNGELTLIEMNTRRCGESHIHNLADILTGETWMDTLYVLSRFPMDVTVESEVRICDVLQVFDDVNRNHDGITAVPVQLSWLKKKRYKGIGYLLIGEKEQAAQAKDRQLIQGLSKLGINPAGL